MKKQLLNGLPLSCKDIIPLAGTLGVTYRIIYGDFNAEAEIFFFNPFIFINTRDIYIS